MDNNKTLEIILKAKDEASKILSNFSENTKKAGESAKKAGELVKGFAVGVAGVASVGAVAFTGLFKFVEKTSQYGDNIDKMSQSLGMSKQGFQELNYVLEQNGASMDGLKMGMKTMSTEMDNVMKSGNDTNNIFSQLGVSITDTGGQLRSQEAVFKDVVSAFEKMEDGTNKNILAQELFSRAGQDLLPLLNQDAGSMEALITQAKELGIILSDDAVNSSVKFGDSLDAVKKSLGNLGAEIGTNVMVWFQKMVDWVIENLPEIKEKFNQFIKPVISGFILIVEKVYNFIKAMSESETVKAILDIIKDAFMRLWERVKELWEALQPYVPILKVIAGILAGAFFGAFILVHGAIRLAITLVTALLNMFSETYTFIKENLVEAIGNDIRKAIEIGANAFDWLKEKVKAVFDSILGFIQPVIDVVSNLFGKLDGLKDKASNVISNVTGGLFGGGKATGGNVTSTRSYVVGEKGPELFTPATNGTITPNNKINNSNTININISGNNLLDKNSGKVIADAIFRDFKLRTNLA